MGEVIHLHDLETSLDSDPARILDIAAKENLSQVIIIGRDQDDNEFFASSIASGPEALWLLARIQKMLLERAD